MKYFFLLFLLSVYTIDIGAQSRLTPTIKLLPNKKYEILKSVKTTETTTPVLTPKNKQIDAKIIAETKVYFNATLETNGINDKGEISSLIEYKSGVTKNTSYNGEIKTTEGPKFSESKYNKKYDDNLITLFEKIKFPKHQIEVGSTFETDSYQQITPAGIREAFYLKNKITFEVTSIENNIITLNFKNFFCLDERTPKESKLILKENSGSGTAKYDINNHVLTNFNTKVDIRFSFFLEGVGKMNSHFIEEFNQNTNLSNRLGY